MARRQLFSYPIPFKHIAGLRAGGVRTFVGEGGRMGGDSVGLSTAASGVGGGTALYIVREARTWRGNGVTA